MVASSLSAFLLAASCLSTASAAVDHDYEILPDQIYAQRESGDLTGDLYLPVVDGASPGIIMIHGGGWRRGDVDDMEKFARRAAAAGFAVFNITYRLAPEHKFPAQLEDVRDAVRWLRSRAADYRIDPDRIGAWGYSAGAHLAMLLGTLGKDALPGDGPGAPSARVAAVVAGAGPTDLRAYPDNKYVAALMPEDADEKLFTLASPLAAVSGDDAGMFLYHGKRDWIVGYRNSVNMLQALRGAGVDARLQDMPHGHIMTYFFGRRAVDGGIDFLRQHLGPVGH
ncbi:MAG: alpha/beta hydrolase [Gammaproteobacteria bacterium]|nr:alpha/beta hydrolase [Gammaproteobacteria bacterium]